MRGMFTCDHLSYMSRWVKEFSLVITCYQLLPSYLQDQHNRDFQATVTTQSLPKLYGGNYNKV